MWWMPPDGADLPMPEKRDNAWYKAPSGELRYVYEWMDDGVTVRVGVQSWEPVSKFAGWALYQEDQWATQRQWAERHGYRWSDE